MRQPLPGMTPMRSQTGNQLLYGDNLTLMQDMPTASVDLIYLDPPFNSQRSYNLIYRNLTGAPVPEQEEAFCDAWEMDPEKEEMLRQTPDFLARHDVSPEVATFWGVWMNALRQTQPSLLAYLLYMSWRLVEMRRILKPTGSLYLHCDPTASHYIKVIMDSIFGHQNFRNEIIWKRTNSHNDSKTWGRVTDTILFYSRGRTFVWNTPREPLNPEYVADKYRFADEAGRRYQLDNMTSPSLRPRMKYDWLGFPPPDLGWRYERDTMQRLHDEQRIWYPRRKDGSLDTTKRPRLKRYLDEMKGSVRGCVWTDISPLNSRAAERLGYPTQKPIALLKRIIEASSNPGDVIFDPFCGCGTAIYAAHETGRKWIGCDIAILSVRIVRDVLARRYGLREGLEYEVRGVPLSVEGAEELFAADKRQFQHWAVELAGGFVNARHSGDRGVDGRIWFETQDGLRAMVISVKGGKLQPAFVRELAGTMAAEANCEMGGFICLQEPTKGMRDAAAAAGLYTYRGQTYPKLQLRSIADLLAGRGFQTPSKVQTMGWQRQGVLALGGD
jgi:DNA modification methylase